MKVPLGQDLKLPPDSINGCYCTKTLSVTNIPVKHAVCQCTMFTVDLPGNLGVSITYVDVEREPQTKKLTVVLSNMSDIFIRITPEVCSLD